MSNVNPRLSAAVIKHKLSIFKRAKNDPFQASETDIENVYEPDQLLDSGKEGEKDEDVEIVILLQIKALPSNKRRVKKVVF